MDEKDRATQDDRHRNWLIFIGKAMTFDCINNNLFNIYYLQGHVLRVIYIYMHYLMQLLLQLYKVSIVITLILKLRQLVLEGLVGYQCTTPEADKVGKRIRSP